MGQVTSLLLLLSQAENCLKHRQIPKNPNLPAALLKVPKTDQFISFSLLSLLKEKETPSIPDRNPTKKKSLRLLLGELKS